MSSGEHVCDGDAFTHFAQLLCLAYAWCEHKKADTGYTSEDIQQALRHNVEAIIGPEDMDTVGNQVMQAFADKWNGYVDNWTFNDLMKQAFPDAE